jgi:hypothetical protein
MQRMRKKVLSLMSVVLVGALMLNSCGCLKEKEEGGQAEISEGKLKKLPEGWTRYENETLGIRMGHPADWKVKEERDRNIDHIIFKDEKRGDMLSVSSHEVKEDYDLTEHTRGEKEDQKEFIIGGKPGIKVTLEIRIGELKPCVNTYIYVIHKGRVFDFNFVEVEELKEHTEACYKVLDTVQFF